MPHNRYYLPERLEIASELSITGDELHHLARVMRTRVGETVELINGQGQLATASVTHLSDKEARVAIDHVEEIKKPEFSLTLVLALLKPNNLEYAIEKATEAGVSRFILFAAARSEKKSLSEQQSKRLLGIILSSTKQCGRLYLPPLEIKNHLKDSLSGQVLFGDLESSTKLSDISLESNVSLVIGPESGLSEPERAYLLDYKAQGCLFLANTLRAETAAVVGSALILNRFF